MTTGILKTSRIAFYEPLGDGGIAHYTFNLIQAIAKTGVDVCLITNRRDELQHNRFGYPVFKFMFAMVGRLLERIPVLDRETTPYTQIRRMLKLIEYPFDLFRVSLLLRRQHTTLVHMQTVNWIDIVFIVLLKMLGIRIVYTVHNVNPLHGKMKKHHRFLFRVSYDMCDHIIIHTQSGKAELGTLFGTNPEKVSVIPHGDYKFFINNETPNPKEAKEAIGISSETPTLLFFGAIRANKGLDLALMAMSALREAEPKAKLIIAGEKCENYSTYRELIRQNGLSGNISEHLRYIANEEVARFFSAADVVVLPYREITQSGVLQIAYAFSKPVVAFALDGFKESIGHGENGLLAPPGNWRIFAIHIQNLLQDAGKRKSFGNKSKILADRNYSWGEIAEKTVKIYSSCLMPTS